MGSLVLGANVMPLVAGACAGCAPKHSAGLQQWSGLAAALPSVVLPAHHVAFGPRCIHGPLSCASLYALPN